METLFIQTATELKTFMLNTKTPSKLIDRIVNDLIDLYPNCDWWIEEGWKYTPHIKHPFILNVLSNCVDATIDSLY